MQHLDELYRKLLKRWNDRYVDRALRLNLSMFPRIFACLIDDLKSGALPYSGPPLTLEQAESLVWACYTAIDDFVPSLPIGTLHPLASQLREAANKASDSLSQDGTTEPRPRKESQAAKAKRRKAVIEPHMKTHGLTLHG